VASLPSRRHRASAGEDEASSFAGKPDTTRRYRAHLNLFHGLKIHNATPHLIRTHRY
jgi:hypothetical protein